MGLNWAEHTVEIAAPIETCFEAITDYETFPSWQSAVVDTEVLDWDAQGRGKRVRLFIDAKVRKVDYTLDYRYDEPKRIEWDFVEGNGINDADGHYLFEDLGDDRTRATYKLGLEVGIPLPGPGRAAGPQLDPEGVGRGPEARGGAAGGLGRPGAPRRPADGSAEAKLAEEVGITGAERRSGRPAPAGRRTMGLGWIALGGRAAGAAGRRGRVPRAPGRRRRGSHRPGGDGGRRQRRRSGLARRAVDAGRGVADAVTGAMRSREARRLRLASGRITTPR